MSRAKRKPNTKQPSIPSGVSQHLEVQRYQARAVSCLLASIIPTIEGITGESAQVADSAGMSLRVVQRLVDEIEEALDSVSLNRACRALEEPGSSTATQD